jgi:glutaredoxin
MKIELFHAPGCSQCADSERHLKATAAEIVSTLDWRAVNVLDELDYAVEVGVLTLPSIAIDGELVFSALPTPGQWRNALLRHAKRKQ